MCPKLPGVAANEDHEVLNALVRLMSNLDDPSVLTDEEIVEAIRQARENRTKAQTVGAAELRRRGWTLRRIADAVGVHFTQPKRWTEGQNGGEA